MQGSYGPELPGEPGALEQLPDPLRRLRLPVVVESIGVPGTRELPHRRQVDDRSAELSPSRAPAVDVCFRPEEADGRSRVADVVPEPPGRDDEVDERLPVNHTLAYSQGDRIAAACAARMDIRVA